MLTTEVERHPEATTGSSAFQLGRASLTYALGGLAYKGIALVTIPILARILTPAQLGLLDLAAVIATLVSLIVVLGTDQALPYLEDRTSSPGGVWGSALAIVGAGAAAAAIVLVLARDVLATALTGDAVHGGTMAAAGMYGGVMAISVFTLTTLRLRASARIYATAAFLTVSIEMAGAFAVALMIPEPVTVMVVAWAVGSALVSAPFLIRHLPRLRAPDRQKVTGLIRFGAPLVPATLTWILGDIWIRAVLGRESDLAALGEYGIAFRFASALGLLASGFGVAWYPYVYRSPDHLVRRRALDALWTVLVVLAGSAAIITILAPELVDLVAGDRYADAAGIVAFLVSGMVFMGVFHVAAGIIGRSGSTIHVALAAFAGGLVQVGGALVLIPSLGLVGAGVASLAGQTTAAIAVLALATPAIGRRTASVGFGLMAGAVAALVLASLGQDLALAARLILAAALAALAALVVYRRRDVVRVQRDG